MASRWIVVVLALAACADPPDDERVVSCEVQLSPRESAPAWELDVVIAISDAPAMAPYADRLAPELGQLMRILATIDGGLPSVQVAIIGDATGGFRSPPGCVDATWSYAVDVERPWFTCDDGPPCRDRNFDGALADAVACLGAVAADGTPAPPILERVVDTLSEHPFVRPNAFLLVVLLTAEDDTSPDTPASYVESLRAFHPGLDRLAVSVVGPRPSPRLDAVLEELPNRSISTEIEADDWANAFNLFSSLGDSFAPGCLDGPHECVATDGASGATIPPCTMDGPERPALDTPLPCWRVGSGGDETCAFQAIVERASWTPQYAILRCPC